MAAAARTAAVREAMEEAGLGVDPDGLVWFAHWTPGPLAARRFATWFFVARAPEGVVVVDDGEIHEHLWIRPAEAMARRDAGEIELIPPTWMTLHMLAEEPSVDAALATARASEPRIYVTHIVRVDGGIASIWQGDAAYDDGDAHKPGPATASSCSRTGGGSRPPDPSPTASPRVAAVRGRREVATRSLSAPRSTAGSCRAITRFPCPLRVRATPGPTPPAAREPGDSSSP